MIISFVSNEEDLISSICAKCELFDILLIPVYLNVAEIVPGFKFFFFPKFSVHLHLSENVLKTIVTYLCKN